MKYYAWAVIGVTLLMAIPSANAKQQFSVPSDSLVASITADFNKDTYPDLALMTRGSEGMDLNFFLGTERGYLESAGKVQGKIWGTAEPDGIFGQQPSLAVTPAGSLQILTQNEAIGRNRWNQTVTLAYREGNFMVAGITHTWRDTLNLDDTGVCDLNVLTGKGTVQKGSKKAETITFKASTTPFEKWDEETALKPCGF